MTPIKAQLVTPIPAGLCDERALKIILRDERASQFYGYDRPILELSVLFL